MPATRNLVVNHRVVGAGELEGFLGDGEGAVFADAVEQAQGDEGGQEA